LGSNHLPFVTDPVLVAPATGDEKNTIRAELVPIACWRLDDLRFEFDSSLILVDAIQEFQHLAILHRIHPGAPMSMFGHADPVGDDDYNKKLSGRRVRAVYAVLTRRMDIWDDLYKHPLGRDDWKKNGAIEALLACTGKDPADAKDYRNDEGRRQALWLEYMELICRDDNLKSYQLQPTDFLAQGADPEGKGDYQGCSEFNPVLMFSKSENDAYAAQSDKTDRDDANAPNRRVNVFLFRPGSKVKFEKWPCARANEGVGPCKKRFWSDWQTRRQFQKERREFKDRRDTFACRFYQRIAAASPCEAGVERSTPVIYFPEEPGANNWVKAHTLYCYLVYFRGPGPAIESVTLCKVKEGRLWDYPKAENRVPLFGNRQAWFYFSHRDDLKLLKEEEWFKRDGTGLPLVGPICIPAGEDPRVNVDIWSQKDWAIVRAKLVDGERLSEVQMCDWHDDYRPGFRGTSLKTGQPVYCPDGDFRHKEYQETWKGSPQTPCPLVQLGRPNNVPMWVGTLSALPTPKAKLLLVHSAGREGNVNVATYNEIAPTGRNQEFPGHHLYDEGLASLLLSVDAKDMPPEQVDALPAPPPRCILPGDICWADQGQTNHCGAYSFYAAMNYWWPYTSNPGEKNGPFYANTDNVPSVIAGARSPANIEEAAAKFSMNARDNATKELEANRALKLVKLWLKAGVPVLVLVQEEYSIWSYHWKTLVGYDGNRFFINNSGADNEMVYSHRDPSVDYEHVPVGNDVDSYTALYTKWYYAGGDIVSGLLAPSVDKCTFMPVYPQDSRFAGGAAR
jgi:hypothetical protein